jgi:NRPS condensation-like uncharacterized protein
LFKQLLDTEEKEMAKDPAQNKAKRLPMAGIKMDKGLFRRAKARAKERHQTLSDYIRQLIVADIRVKA